MRSTTDHGASIVFRASFPSSLSEQDEAQDSALARGRPTESETAAERATEEGCGQPIGGGCFEIYSTG